MSRLETPVKHVLRNVTTPASVARMWSRIEARGRGERGERRPPLHQLAFAYRFALAAALLVVVLGTVGLVMYEAAPVTMGQVGPLVLADGSPLQAAHPDGRAATLALSDGSTLVLDEDTAVDVLENSGTAVRLSQSRGGVLYDIKPGGPRRWMIEYGVVTVEVIGTSFRVEPAGPVLRVAVIRGNVLVRGDGVPGRVARLSAGMELEIADPSSSPPPPSSAGPLPIPLSVPLSDPPSIPPSVPLSVSPTLSSPITSPEVAAQSARTRGWRDLARRGENEKAYAELGSAGVARAARSASVDDLLALADVARLSGHPEDAVGPLERVVTGHPADSRASLAAFTLGRVRLDSLHAPAAAAHAFEKAIALGIPGGLAEDAYVHLAEARAKAGDEEGAKAAYHDYVRRFPAGTRKTDFRRWVPSAVAVP